MSSSKILLVILLILQIACSNQKLTFISCFLQENIEWESSVTGDAEIDSSRMEANTSIIIHFEEMLVKGKIHLYKEKSSGDIYVAYECGIIEFVYEDCVKVSDTINTTYILDGESLIFKDNKELVYQNRTYVETNKMFEKTNKDLKTIISKEIKNCKR